MTNRTIDKTLGDLTEGLKLRNTTIGLVNNILLDLPLTLAQALDFGVDTPDHYRALKAILITDGPDTHKLAEDEIRGELRKRIAALDQALGNGGQITALVRQYAPQYGHIFFVTTW